MTRTIQPPPVPFAAVARERKPVWTDGTQRTAGRRAWRPDPAPDARALLADMLAGATLDDAIHDDGPMLDDEGWTLSRCEPFTHVAGALLEARRDNES